MAHVDDRTAYGVQRIGRSRTNRGFALKSRGLRPAGCGVWERVDDVSTVSKIKQIQSVISSNAAISRVPGNHFWLIFLLFPGITSAYKLLSLALRGSFQWHRIRVVFTHFLDVVVPVVAT